MLDTDTVQMDSYFGILIPLLLLLSLFHDIPCAIGISCSSVILKYTTIYQNLYVKDNCEIICEN